jgi:mRNA-degrading endonuclease RelE of RelBE toxin-antitoxin system
MPQWFHWDELARQQLRSIDKVHALQILRAVNRLRFGLGDVERLQAVDPPQFRLKVGDYRVRFRPRGRFFDINQVAHRRDVYR